MGLMDKFKNLFTEEVEEEKPIQKEVRHVEIPSPTPKREKRVEEPVENVSDSTAIHKETKPSFSLYFDDKDFDDLEKPKKEEKVEKEVPKVEAYQGAKTQKTEHKFEASPIISPVYGILDKNYKKEDIATKKEQPGDYTRKPRVITVDDIRNKAFGTLEDDLEDTLFGDKSILFDENETSSTESEGIDIFNDLEQAEQQEENEEQELIKEEPVEDMDVFTDEELPEEPVMEDISTKETLAVSEDSEDMDDDTVLLAKQLEEQKKKLEQINEYINESSTEEETEDIIEEPKIKHSKEENEETEDLSESELLNLVDAMYEKRDDD